MTHSGFDIDARLDIADALMKQMDWANAREAWADLRQNDPDRLKGWLQGIEAAVRCYHPDETARLFEEVKQRFPRNYNARMALAAFTARHGDWTRAVTAFRNVERDFPRNAEAVRASPIYRQAILNIHGVIEGSRHLPDMPAPHPQDGESVPEPEAYVFVSGMPRAGTSALGRLLNTSREIALFTEIYFPYRAYHPSSFARSCLEKRLRVAPNAAPGDLLDRASEARFIGDKRPLFHYTILHSSKALAGHRMVIFHILRPVLDVVRSYQKRADDPKDNWDPLRDAENCIHELNVMHRMILDLVSEGGLEPRHEIIYVDYLRVFSEIEYALGMFRMLGIEIHSGLEAATETFQKRSSTVLAKSRTLDPSLMGSLHEKLDWDLAHAVVQQTGINILAGFDEGAGVSAHRSP